MNFKKIVEYYKMLNHNSLEKAFEKKFSDLNSKGEKSKYKKVINEIITKDVSNLENPQYIFETYFKNLNLKDSYKITLFSQFSCLIGIATESTKEKLSDIHQKYVDYYKPLQQQKKVSQNENPIVINIQETNEYKNFIENLYKKYPLRSDYCSVLLNIFNKNQDNYYENGKIYFNPLIKVPKKDVLIKELDEPDIAFIEKLKGVQDELYKCDSNNKNGSFIKFIQRHLGHGIMYYRRLYFTNFVNERNLNINDISKLLKTLNGEYDGDETININLKNFNELVYACKNANTSISKVVSNYYRDIKDVDTDF